MKRDAFDECIERYYYYAKNPNELRVALLTDGNIRLQST